MDSTISVNNQKHAFFIEIGRLLKEDNVSESIEMAESFFEQHSSDSLVIMILAYCYYRDGQYKRAESLYGKLNEQDRIFSFEKVVASFNGSSAEHIDYNRLDSLLDEMIHTKIDESKLPENMYQQRRSKAFERLESIKTKSPSVKKRGRPKKIEMPLKKGEKRGRGRPKKLTAEEAEKIRNENEKTVKVKETSAKTKEKKK